MRDEKPEKIEAILNMDSLSECQKIDQTMDVLCGNYDKYDNYRDNLDNQIKLFDNLLSLENQVNTITHNYCTILEQMGNEQKQERDYRFNVREGIEDDFKGLEERMEAIGQQLDSEVINDPDFYKDLNNIRSVEVFDAVNNYTEQYHLGDLARKVMSKIKKTFSKPKENRAEKLARIKFSALQRFRQEKITDWAKFKTKIKSNYSKKQRGNW